MGPYRDGAGNDRVIFSFVVAPILVMMLRSFCIGCRAVAGMVVQIHDIANGGVIALSPVLRVIPWLYGIEFYTPTLLVLPGRKGYLCGDHFTPHSSLLCYPCSLWGPHLSALLPVRWVIETIYSLRVGQLFVNGALNCSS